MEGPHDRRDPNGGLMPRPKANPTSISEEALWKLAAKGHDSGVLAARLEWTDAEGIARYVRPLQGKSHIRPRILPTAQVSARWSTTDPPRTNWPRHDAKRCPECKGSGDWCPRAVRDIVTPEDGTFWIKGDAEAIEARIAACYTRDEVDLEAFSRGLDLHTLTACAMFNLPRPADASKKGIAADTAWRDAHQWAGDDDTRRSLAKTFRYAWQYGVDERAVLLAKDIVKLGKPRGEILEYARLYQAGKPAFFAARQAYMEQCLITKESRTFLGRLRRLWGNPHRPADAKTIMKEGWNHRVQGSVSDMVNIIVAKLAARWPESWLVSNAYDALEWGFPATLDPSTVISEVTSIVEAPWDIEGVSMTVPWSFKVVRP